MTRFFALLPLLFAMAVTFFLIGVAITHLKLPPYPQLRDAKRTFDVLVLGKGVEKSPVPERIAVEEGGALASRWTDLDRPTPRAPILVNGGPHRFLEACGGQGCAAVVFGETGEITQAWPYRPREILEADLVHDSLPHEAPTFDPMQNMRIISAKPYGDGDLWLTIQTLGAVFPFGLGVTRIGPDGAPRWSRVDFSHHWSTVLDNGDVLVPGVEIRDSPVVMRHGEGPGAYVWRAKCPTGRSYFDLINVLNGEGEVIKSLDMTEAFLDSNWRGALTATVDQCDPLHLNYIDEIGLDAPAGAAAGDFLISLRNISRVAIVDRETGKLKKVAGGSFVRQHAATHLGGAEVAIFDNLGGDLENGPSRIIALNLETGVERVIFPRPDTPAPFDRLFTDRAGQLSLSEDGERMLISYTYSGIGIEIDIETGAVLAVMENLHDLSAAEGLADADRAAIGRFQLHEMVYAR